MSISFNPHPFGPGNECQEETLVPLGWADLAIRFDDEVLAADFGDWIDEDLGVMENRLSHFATKSMGRRAR